jgi:hypothetical protein
MLSLKGGILCMLAFASVAPSIAEAQTQSTPRIVMRRPLNPSATTGGVEPTCGVEGKPACATDCDFVGATWEVGQWQGDACGDGGTVTRSVKCMAIRSNGDKVQREDSFCLQDASTFHNNCNAPSGTPNL